MTETDPQLRKLMRAGYRHALALCHDPRRAEDLLQQAWLSMLTANATPSAAYLRRAVRSRFLDSLPRERREIPTPPGTAEPSAEPGAQRLASERERLDEALGRLSPTDREALLLCVVEGYTAAEVAAMVGSPLGTILARVHRAKKRLRALLDCEGKAS